MMGKRLSASDDSSNDECELKTMLIDKCKMCRTNLDTDHHKNICDHHSDDDRVDGERDDRN